MVVTRCLHPLVTARTTEHSLGRGYRMAKTRDMAGLIALTVVTPIWAGSPSRSGCFGSWYRQAEGDRGSVAAMLYLERWG
jgi:hypothetical protein